jgi:hypothetical protein
MKLRKGRTVRCEIAGRKITDAKIQEEDRFYICQNEVVGTECSDKLGYKYAWDIGPGTEEALRNNDVTNLITFPLTIQDIDVGDEVKNKSGMTSIVLGRLNDLVFLSSCYDKEYYPWSDLIQELIKEGYTVVQPKEEVKEEMITIDGKEYSKATIKQALKEYVE